MSGEFVEDKKRYYGPAMGWMTADEVMGSSGVQASRSAQSSPQHVELRRECLNNAIEMGVAGEPEDITVLRARVYLKFILGGRG